MSNEHVEINKDTKVKSLSEAFVNSFGGFPIGYCVGIIILPLSAPWITKDPFVANILITLVYASVSFVRIYFLRRIFTKFGFDEKFVKSFSKLFHKSISLKNIRGQEFWN